MIKIKKVPMVSGYETIPGTKVEKAIYGGFRYDIRTSAFKYVFIFYKRKI